ncbi:MAG TPA: nucleoside deaminase [Ignavibacteria bacterium]|nr:nucleoside deaminase [Ignavibacteria bacterium]
MDDENIHLKWMMAALSEAEKAFDEGEVPVGCIIVFKNRIIAKSHNLVETLRDATAHAELMAITSASENLSSKVLEGCSMYVTLEPCAMCAGAIVLSKISNLYFGAYDPKAGACGSVMNITENKRLNHTLSVYGGILDNMSRSLLDNFFSGKRNITGN